MVILPFFIIQANRLQVSLPAAFIVFDESIMMFTAPSINQLRNIVVKEISKCLARLRNGSLSWLAEYVEIFSEKVYIKGYDKTWHVTAKTASKHNPTTIAGEHADNYFLW